MKVNTSLNSFPEIKEQTLQNRSGGKDIPLGAGEKKIRAGKPSTDWKRDHELR